MSGFGAYNDKFISLEGGWPVPMPELPQPKTPEEAEKLGPGTEFLDPSGKKKVVPYRPKTPDEAATLPEGSLFVTPEGKEKRTPTYQGVGFTAQMLHDMALTDEGREQALKVVYGDKVKRGAQGLYVEDEGDVFRKPDGRGLSGAVGHAASEVFPLAGMTAGGVAGGALGSEIPVAGTVGGAAFGGMIGAAAGRQVNNAVLALAGVHESAAEQLQSQQTEAALAAIGEGAGKVISKLPGVGAAATRGVSSLKDRAKGLKENLSGTLEALGITPERARWILGTSLEEAEQAARISESGGRVPPSAIFHESPYLSKMEEFDAVFRAQNVFGEAAENYYNQEMSKVLQSPEIGASVDQLLTRAEKKVSSEEAGKLAISAAQKDLAHDDAVLENAVRDVKGVAESEIERLGGKEGAARSYQERLEALNEAHRNADASARRYIDAQVERLQEQIDEALTATKRGEDPSAPMRMAAAEFRLWGQGIKARAKQLYNAADQAAGDAKPDVSGLADDARQFLDSLPEALRNKYPVEIRDLQKLASDNAIPFDPNKPPQDLTFGQMHHLRSWFRYGIDYNDLTPDMRQGSLKFFEKKINSVLHDAGAPEELKTAAEMLDRADAFYKQEVPFLNDEMITGVIKAMESGAGANPEALAKILFDPERTAALRRVRGIVGENLWKSVQAAHVNDMLMASRTIDGRVDATKFAQMVHSDVKNGLISTGYDERMARQVAEIAQDVAKLEGKLPINVNPGDTLATLVQRTQAAKEAAEKFAETDPIKAFDSEIKKLDSELSTAQKMMKRARGQAPLHFLEQPQMSHMAVKAADKILSSQDLIMAAADKFGRNSSEFNALRQVYTMRFAQRALGRTAGMRAELGGEKGMTEEMQALMFPGVTRSQMLQVVHDMEFLFGGRGTDVGGAMAAASRVLNPTAHLPLPKLGVMGRLITGFPGVAFVSRIVLGKFFALVMDAVSHPNFMAWLGNKLTGSEAEREAARAVLQRRFVLGGWGGAVTAQVLGNPAQQDQQ